MRRRLTKAAAEVVELVEIPEGDANLAVLAAVANRHFRPEFEAELFLKRARVGVDRRGPFSRPRGLAGILAKALDVSDRQAFGDDPVGERVRIGDGEQGARVPGRDFSARQQGARMLRQVGQANVFAT